MIFAVALPLTLVAFAWGGVLFSSQEITEIFTEELVGSGALQEIAVEVLLEQVPRGGEDLAAGILDFLGRQRLDEMLAALFTVEWAESQVRTNIEVLYAGIDNDHLVPDFFLDVRDFHEYFIVRQPGSATVELYIDSNPVPALSFAPNLCRLGAFVS